MPRVGTLQQGLPLRTRSVDPLCSMMGSLILFSLERQVTDRERASRACECLLLPLPLPLLPPLPVFNCAHSHAGKPRQAVRVQCPQS